MDMMDKVYSDFDHANKVKFGAITGQQIITAVKANNVSEVERLMSLPADEGGLILLRLTQQDENGKTAIQIAQEMGNEKMIAIFKP